VSPFLLRPFSGVTRPASSRVWYDQALLAVAQEALLRSDQGGLSVVLFRGRLWQLVARKVQLPPPCPGKRACVLL
jgi:hypothetical protein